MISSSIHFPEKWHHFILLYGWIILHCVYTSHFSDPYTDGHRGWLHTWQLWIVMQKRERACKCLYCILTYIPSDIYPGVVTQDCMAILFLDVWRTSILISGCTNLQSHHQCIKVFFPCILTNIFYNTRSDWVEIQSQCRFDLHFLFGKGHWTFFLYLWAIYTSFEKCLFNAFVHLLTGLFVLLVFSFFSSLYILDINPYSNE
jgi:hypothetical protein